MSRKNYISPSLRIIETRLSDIILLSGTDEKGQNVINNGGTTSSAGITESDANQRQGTWGNLW